MATSSDVMNEHKSSGSGGSLAAAGGHTSPSVSPRTPDGKQEVYKIVLTGGPCGGKTTSAAVIQERFEARGWKVFSVPEAATVLLQGGINFYNLSVDQVYNFQTNLLKVMMSLEDAFTDIAKACGQKAIIICDRGAMDCCAYIEPSLWQAILDENGWTPVELRDSRYDCVIHLVSAADGAEKFYTTADHSVRSETPEKARELDRKIKESWVGHPYLCIVDNATDFKKKVERVVESIYNFVGEKAPISGLTKRKFLVKSVSPDFPLKYQDYEVEHDYLVTNDETQARLRKRGQYGSYVYTLTVRFPELHGQILQLRRNLSGREYISVRQQQKDNERQTVRKLRRSFIYKNQYYELDTFKTCKPGVMLLEAYVPADAEIEIPDFINVVREVTKEKEFSMFQMSLTEERSLADQIKMQFADTHGRFGD